MNQKKSAERRWKAPLTLSTHHEEWPILVLCYYVYFAMMITDSYVQHFNVAADQVGAKFNSLMYC